MIDTEEETHDCGRLWLSTDEEGYHRLRRATAVSAKERQSVESEIWIERLDSAEGSVDLLREDPVIAPFLERIAWPLRQFYLHKIYIDC